MNCIILGGGGHARVLIDALQETAVSLYGLLDPDATLWGKQIMSIPVLGDDSLLPELAQTGIVEAFIVGLGGTRNNQPRRKLFEFACNHGLQPVTVIHPRAICSSWANIGVGAQILPGAIVNAGAVVGRNTIINSGGIVEHDCQIGDHVHVATGATLSGMVVVGMGAHIGAGATVKQGITIGEQAVVGAGAAVVKDVLAGQVVVGVPARPLSHTA